MSNFGAESFKPIIVTFVCYILGYLFLQWLKQGVDLADSAAILKTLSLTALVILGGELAIKVDEQQKDIKWLNIGIVAISLLLLILLFLKLFDFSLENTSFNQSAKNAFNSALKSSYWLSGLPIFLYGILNGYIAFFRAKGSEEEKKAALRFFVFSDLVCIAPMIAVLTIAWLYSSSDPGSIEAFVNGAMAMIIIASNTSTKVIKQYFYN